MRIKIGLTAIALGGLAALGASQFAIAQQYVVPNLHEDNITRARPRTPGLPNDYILISPGGSRILRFDWPISRIVIDDPDILDAVELEENSVRLKATPVMGVTRLIIQGRRSSELAGRTNGQRAEVNERLLFHALVGIGHRIVAGGSGTGTGPGTAARSYDCTPMCIYTPGREPREPDQIIEYRGTGQPAPPAATSPSR